MRRLFEQCREFQMNSEAFLNVYKNPDASIPEDIRVVNEDDLERIDGITTFEELKDMVVCIKNSQNSHFQSTLIVICKLNLII